MGLYVRLSCEVLTDAKILQAGPEAAMVWVRGLLYSKQHLTDGLVPVGALPLVTLGAVDSALAIQRLVDAGLWITVDGGYHVGIEKWARYQTTREEVETKREFERERKARRRAGQRGDAQRDDTPSPADVPVGHARDMANVPSGCPASVRALSEPEPEPEPEPEFMSSSPNSDSPKNPEPTSERTSAALEAAPPVGVGSDADGVAPKIAASKRDADAERVREVFAAYRKYHQRSFPNPNSKSHEWKLILRRLHEGYTVDDLRDAIDGLHLSPFHLGDNDRGTKYLDLALALRDAGHVDKFRAIKHDPGGRPRRREGPEPFVPRADRGLIETTAREIRGNVRAIGLAVGHA